MNSICESVQKVLGNKVPKNLGLVERCVLMEKIISISETLLWDLQELD